VNAALGCSLQQWSQQPKLSTALLKALAVQRQLQATRRTIHEIFMMKWVYWLVVWNIFYFPQ